MRALVIVTRCLAIVGFLASALGLTSVVVGHMQPPESTYPLGPNLWLTPSIVLALVSLGLLWIASALSDRAKGRA